MKKLLVLAVVAMFTTSLIAQTQVVLKNAVDSANYAYGMVMAANVKRQMGKDFNPALYEAAFKAALDEKPTVFQVDNANKIFSDYNRSAQTKALQAYKAEQKKFLDSNKTRSGVVTTASGLQYEVLQKTTDPAAVSPKATDKVEVHYHGTLIDGTVFDSSVNRGEKISFGLNQVIRGWTEGLQLMKTGEKFRFFIPAELAYGDNPRAGGVIKPGAALIFDVELFRVNP